MTANPTANKGSQPPHVGDAPHAIRMEQEVNENMSRPPNVIKKLPTERTPLAGSGIVQRSLIDAHAAAERIVADAEEYAAGIRSQIDDAARAAREAASGEGFEAGLGELNAHLLDAAERRDTALARAESDLLRLAIKLAEKIVGRLIEQSDDTIADIVATALLNARQQESLSVRVCPADLPAINARRARLEANPARFISFVADPNIFAGGCVIETPVGTIDAQLDTQLRVLERALLARAATEKN